MGSTDVAGRWNDRSIVLCLDADESPIDPAIVEELLRKAKKSSNRIRCPLCGWVPGKHDRWACTCGYTWNTFDTRGKCPACSFQWRATCCLRCHEWSPHESWYEKDDGGPREST